MESLRDIRRRIRSSKNTRKMTRAMKLVAAARLKRAQNAVVNGRQYAEGIRKTAQRVSERLGAGAPMLWRRAEELNCMDIFVVTSDRGLCGGFNEDLLRTVEDGIEEHLRHGISSKIFVTGRQGERYFSGRDYDCEFASGEAGSSLEAVIDWAISMMIERYCDRKSAGGYVAFNRFVSAMKYRPTFWNMLPLYKRGEDRVRFLEYRCEPEKVSALNALCAEMLASTARQALLESKVAELSARVFAMDQATRNADDMIAHLTRRYNRARQEAITSELMDIVGGAEALR